MSPEAEHAEKELKGLETQLKYELETTDLALAAKLSAQKHSALFLVVFGMFFDPASEGFAAEAVLNKWGADAYQNTVTESVNAGWKYIKRFKDMWTETRKGKPEPRSVRQTGLEAALAVRLKCEQDGSSPEPGSDRFLEQLVRDANIIADRKFLNDLAEQLDLVSIGLTLNVCALVILLGSLKLQFWYSVLMNMLLILKKLQKWNIKNEFIQPPPNGQYTPVDVLDLLQL